MKVLLDARPIIGRKTGDRTYWLGLLRELPAAAPEWQFIAAVDQRPEAGLLPRRANLRIEVVAQPGGRLWTLVALPRLAARLGVDLVHLQYSAPPWLPCPFVTTVHDCSYELLPRTFRWRDRLLLRWSVPRACRRAGAVVGVSETTRRDLLRLYRLPPDRVFAVPNGIGAEFAPAGADAVAVVREKYALPERYLLSVGLLQPRKNLLGLVWTMAELRRLGDETPLVIVGRVGWGQAPVLAAIERLGLSDRIRFAGYVPDGDLPALYTGATLFCYPSYYEGFGLPPLESAACGTLPLVSDTPALVEVTGEAVPHLPPDAAEEWAATLVRLLADDGERARRAGLARERAALFTWRRSAERHLQAYRTALAG